MRTNYLLTLFGTSFVTFYSVKCFLLLINSDWADISGYFSVLIVGLFNYSWVVENFSATFKEKFSFIKNFSLKKELYLITNSHSIVKNLASHIRDGDKMTMGGCGGYINSDTPCLSSDKANEKVFILNRGGTPPHENFEGRVPGPGPGRNGEGSYQVVRDNKGTESNTYIPTANQPWADGTKQKDLHRRFMKRRGYFYLREGKFSIIYRHFPVRKYQYERNLAKFLEDHFHEYRAAGGRQPFTSIPYDKLCDKDQIYIKNMFKEINKCNKSSFRLEKKFWRVSWYIKKF